MGRYVFALVVVLSLLAVCLLSYMGEAPRCLGGFWSASDAYLREAGLAEMCVYFAPLPSVSAWGALSGRVAFDAYLFMANDAGVLCNQAARARFACGVAPMRRPVYDGTCRLDLGDADAADCPLPARMRFMLTPALGTLALYDGDVLLGYLHKDSVATEAAVLAGDE